jgi:diketogulonate reductase-like aldo/keto reductase
VQNLGVTCVDSYILHSPSRRSSVGLADWETWRAMGNVVDENVVGFLGITNVRVDQLSAILDCARIRSTFAQNRCFAMVRWGDEVCTLYHAANVVYQGSSLIS